MWGGLRKGRIARFWQIDKKHPHRIAGGFAHKDAMFFDRNHLCLNAFQLSLVRLPLMYESFFFLETNSGCALTHSQCHYVAYVASAIYVMET